MEHSHEVVTHLYHIELPYGLSGRELEFEPHVTDYTDGSKFRIVLADLSRNFSEEECRRILAGAVALIEKFPHRHLGEAIYTAMVWERG